MQGQYNKIKTFTTIIMRQTNSNIHRSARIQITKPNTTIYTYTHTHINPDWISLKLTYSIMQVNQCKAFFFFYTTCNFSPNAVEYSQLEFMIIKQYYILYNPIIRDICDNVCRISCTRSANCLCLYKNGCLDLISHTCNCLSIYLFVFFFLISDII